jgi:hypothetical protein
MQITQEIDNKLVAVLDGYKQRSALQLMLRSCDKNDYGKDSEKGKLLTSLLGQMETVELKTLTSLAELLGFFEVLCQEQGIAPNGLDSIRLFKPHKAIVRVLSGRTAVPLSFFDIGCKTYNMLIQRSNQDNEATEPSGLTDARHFVQFDDNVYDVVDMMQSLIRLWSLVLESNFECEEHPFVIQSRSVEAEVWVTGGFYDAGKRKLLHKLTPTQQNESPELIVIKRDIQDRLKKICFYYCERHGFRENAGTLCGRDAQEKSDA